MKDRFTQQIDITDFSDLEGIAEAPGASEVSTGSAVVDASVAPEMPEEKASDVESVATEVQPAEVAVRPVAAEVKTEPTRRRRSKGKHYKKHEVSEETKETAGSILREWAVDIVIALLLALLIMQFIKPTIIRQHSMEPNFEPNDYVLVSKQSYKLFGGEPELGDVIVFESNLDDGDGGTKLLIKRVIGVPGDVIDIADGKVYVNGEEIDDSYTKLQTTNGNITGLVVEEGTLFCLGDNRTRSEDSRSDSIGLVSEDDVVGKVVFRIFPLNKIGFIDNPYED